MALAAAAGAVLVVFSSIVGVEACNGHASFCMLLGERMISGQMIIIIGIAGNLESG